MHVTFVAVGKPSSGWVAAAVDHYKTFLSRYTPVETLFVRSSPSRSRSSALCRKAEAERLLKTVSGRAGFKIACDAGGSSFDSRAFARQCQTGLERHGGRMVAVIGGAWGLDKAVLAWADLVWSLGPLTLPHELALIVAMEQVARAFSINRGESYHK